MKSLIKRSLVVGICSISLTVPLHANANERVFQQKELYEIRTLSGQFKAGIVDGNLLESHFASPSAILEMVDGNLLVSDTENHLIRYIDSKSVSSYSGNILDFDAQGFAVGAYNDGAKDSAFFNSPLGLAQDVQGNIYVADSKNHAIRKIALNGTVSTVAGDGILGIRDGIGRDSRFYLPSDLVVDNHGNIYVTDTLNHAIRKIDASGNVTTLNKLSEKVVEYHSGAIVDTGDFKDGQLEEALFNEPSSLAIDHKGNLYVSDTGNQRIRYIDFTTNTVTTVAGGGLLHEESLYVATGYKDGDALDARFANPSGINLASDGTLLIADSNNHVIRVLTDGKVMTLAGQSELEGKFDGLMSTGQFSRPTDVLERTDGSIVITDSENNKVRVIQRYTVENHTEDGQIHVFVNGKFVKSDVATQKIDNELYVPIQAITETLGYEVKTHLFKQTSTVIVNDQLKYVFSTKGSTIKKVSSTGEEKLAITGLYYKNELLLPTNFITQEFGLDVTWDEPKQHLVIRSKIFE